MEGCLSPLHLVVFWGTLSCPFICDITLCFFILINFLEIVFILFTAVLWFFLLLLSTLWWMRLRVLCKLSSGSNWQCENLGLALLGRAKLSKTSINLFADGWDCTSSLLVLWPGVTQSWCIRQDQWWPPRELMPRGTFQDCCCQCLCPHSEPFLVHASTGDPPTLAGRSGSVSCGVTAPFLCSLCAQEFLCAIQEWNLYLPQSCESSVIKYHWLLMSDFLEIPSPLTRSPGCEAWHWAQDLHNSGRAYLVLLFSSLWVSYSRGMGLGFFMITPVLLSNCGFLFVFGHGVTFLIGSSVLLLMVVQQLVAILELLQKISTLLSILPS